ncbi:MAG: signal recognition particle-docking protein FtsY [Pseudomonadota bacterium]
MSFFGKLKQRLFKSSSKLDEGLEALVEDGGEVVEEPVAVTTAPQGTQKPEPAAEMPGPTRPDPQSARDPMPAPSTQSIPEPVVKEPAFPEPPAAEPVAPHPVSTERSAPEPVAEAAPKQAGSRWRLWGRGADVAEPPGAAASPPSEEATPLPASAPEPVTPSILDSEPEKDAKPGFFGRMMGAGAEKKRVLDDAMLEGLEEILITADMGVDTALKLSARIAEDRFGRRVGTREIKAALSTEIAAVLEPVARPLPLYAKRPQVVLVVGVNGSGKTTTIGKLASQLKSAGKSVVIAAGDTFRAAAVEQLQIWGDRAGVPVLTAPQGSDPASLAFEAMERAETDGADLLLIDTAGRLQNRADLMEELAKIVRVIRKKDPEAPHNTVLVLDATTGQNALSQVEIFQKIADVTGLVMTKLDGTAKGGVLVALADRFNLPIHAIGVGEGIEDLDAFDPAEFAAALTGTAE